MYESEGITYITKGNLGFIFPHGSFNTPHYQPIPHSFIKLSLARIDKALSNDRNHYVGCTRGNGCERKEDKIVKLKAGIPNTRNVEMPSIFFNQGDPKKLVVSSGRHRLTCLLELDFKHVWCVIPKEQYDLFQAHFS